MLKRATRGGRHLLRNIAPIVLLVGMLSPLLPVRADDQPQFGIRPANPGADGSTSGYFTLKAQAGETVKDAVVVANPGTVPVKVAVYPVDATSGQNGGAVYMSDTDPRTGVGAWITLETATVEIAPQKQETIPFTLAVPKGAAAGQHLGGIAVQLDRNTSAATPQAGSFGVTTITRALTAVLVNVGEISATPSLRITGAQIATVDGLPTLTLSIQNDGSTLVKSHGDVSVTDGAGKTVLASQMTLDTLIPQTTIAYPVQADPPATPGTYMVRATLDFGGGAPAVFQGPVIVTALPTATPATNGRQRTTPQANATAATKTSASGSSPLIAILAGVIGLLVIAMVGLVAFVVRSQKRRPH